MERPLILVSGAVEGSIDETVLIRLIELAGGSPGTIHVMGGKSILLAHLPGFNNAARRSPWVVLVDLDNEDECAPKKLRDWLPHPSPHMRLRIVKREIESWLLADASGMAAILGVAVTLILRDGNPDEIADPKARIVHLAGRSRSRSIRESLVPRAGSRRQVGPGYDATMIRFVQETWNPRSAAERSDSLKRCMDRIHALVTNLQVLDVL